jgi:hypothetical protein
MADQASDRAGLKMQPAAELLPVVYAELRRLAASLAGRLPPGQTLQRTKGHALCSSFARPSRARATPRDGDF